ncbi:(2R)-3-sulfolactate dehydrogenase (NADP+) [Roseinatronobacter bogoriensis subsp. barguzinensis]|uniref:Sulfolactate dehydrogenase n=2 Tax=Roseinatronobacter bogoriensis TaxID=119542 RepID=A0A2K8KEA7_9RHOB|nr:MULTISPECIES: Ldh family oxidoreductase [Rhodobaca]ATX67739.1 sulfolactate dehydrogenase [Rhodobaca barguzinensis]TDW39053.1 (2R)-3-sulfolactate dehydrogenase (NADP+) [Rhodobaca barguzinensis]TDY68765.1 (2R)-3-sulfolactate dehydrogenase (NADP+) [Rhodobaca bogoriensis DSM 18756]
MTDMTLSLDQVEVLARQALVRAGATVEQAASVARSTRLAERDGIRSHGLMYVPIYAEHLRCGKVLGTASPVVSRPRPAAVQVDAAHGFAHAAIDAGWPEFDAAVREQGIAAMAVSRSYNCGVLGHHAERLAEAGLVGLCFTNAPASMAPIGGTKPVIGTNPFALAVPDGAGRARLVIDQSASAIAKSEIILRARKGEAIEPGWALDADGQPTEDAEAALAGSMLPAGGQKGFGMGLMVEVFAAALSGGNLGLDASPFSGPKGGPPGTGQFFISVDPAAFSGDGFHAAITRLAGAITDQPGTRLPGARRTANRKRIESEGVQVDAALMDRIKAA